MCNFAITRNLMAIITQNWLAICLKFCLEKSFAIVSSLLKTQKSLAYIIISQKKHPVMIVTWFQNTGLLRVIVIFPFFVPVADRVFGSHQVWRPNAEQILAKRIIRLMHELVVFGQCFGPRQRVMAQLNKTYDNFFN